MFDEINGIPFHLWESLGYLVFCAILGQDSFITIRKLKILAGQTGGIEKV